MVLLVTLIGDPCDGVFIDYCSENHCKALCLNKITMPDKEKGELLGFHAFPGNLNIYMRSS